MQGNLMFEQPTSGSNLLPLPELRNVKSLGFDTETTTEKWMFDRSLAGISYYLPDGTKGYIPLRHPGGGNYDESIVSQWAHRELRGKVLVVANGKHEHHTMKKWGIDLEEQNCSFNDVFHSASLIQEKRYKVNMEILCNEEGLAKTPASHTMLHQLPAEAAAKIAIEDAELAWKLSQIYEPRIQAEGLGRVLALENDLIFSTCEMERNGSYIDVELLLKWSVEVQQELEVRVLRLRKETGMSLSPTKSLDMSRLFRFLNIDNPYTTEGGEEAWDEEHLSSFVGMHPLVSVAMEARQLASFWAKYFKPYIASVRPDGRIYYSLHQMRGDEGGACTGRYSSSKMYKAVDGGINVQQVVKTKKMPKMLQRWPIRKLFIAPPGEEWVSSDASQIEYRTFAHYAAITKNPWTGEFMPRVADLYQENPHRDFHNMVMAWTGLPRDETKNVNFCKLYGGRARKIMYMINMTRKMLGQELITLQDAIDFENRYDNEFPEAKVLMQVTENVARYRGYVCTMLGRRRRFELNSKHERYYSALNCVLQGGAAELMKTKILMMYRNRQALGLKMRSTVHDEENSTKPAGVEGRLEIARFMDEQLIPMRVPILWETAFGPNWEETKKLELAA